MGLKSYFWFDTPDGQDILKKTNFISKAAFVITSPIAAMDLLHHRNAPFKSAMFRCACLVVPAVGTAATFSVVSQMLCREVPSLDQRYSYGIGGACAGSVIGAACRSMYAGSLCGFYFGIAAILFRDMASFYPDRLETLSGNLPKVLNNDDLFFQHDYQNQPPLSLPPPGARPSIPGSDYESWII